MYVTKYKGGGATVSDVYRYYLDTKLQDNLLEHLKKRSPFMVADTGDAKISGYGSHVNVNLTGRVYSFTNSDLFTQVMWPSCPLSALTQPARVKVLLLPKIHLSSCAQLRA